MKKLIQISILVILVSILVWKSGIVGNIFKPREVQAVGALTIDLGVPNGDPIFTFNNIQPGDIQTHTVTVNNNDTKDRLIGIKGIKTSGTGDLESQMDIVISQNGSDIYGGDAGAKTLADFFHDSQTINGVSLTTIPKSSLSSYQITVSFKSGAGNEFQKTDVQFNLQFGIVTDVPLACENIHFDHTITGTAGNDTLHGTNGNDLILGLEGDNKITGGNGTDCIIVGNGDNRINSGNGKDVITTGNGNNIVDSGNDDDIITTGNGNNTVSSGNGNDSITTGAGSDRINAGNGNDIVNAGAGDDTITGGNGNDILIGGDGIDKINGGNGKDTCEGETKAKCEL